MTPQGGMAEGEDCMVGKSAMAGRHERREEVMGGDRGDGGREVGRER